MFDTEQFPLLGLGQTLQLNRTSTFNVVDSALVPATGHVRILSMVLTSSVAGQFYFRNYTDSLAISARWFAAEPVILPFNMAGWAVSATGQGIKSGHFGGGTHDILLNWGIFES